MTVYISPPSAKMRKKHPIGQETCRKRRWGHVSKRRDEMTAGYYWCGRVCSSHSMQNSSTRYLSLRQWRSAMPSFISRNVTEW